MADGVLEPLLVGVDETEVAAFRGFCRVTGTIIDGGGFWRGPDVLQNHVNKYAIKTKKEKSYGRAMPTNNNPISVHYRA